MISYYRSGLSSGCVELLGMLRVGSIYYTCFGGGRQSELAKNGFSLWFTETVFKGF
jgi:hypothetical protein